MRKQRRNWSVAGNEAVFLHTRSCVRGDPGSRLWPLCRAVVSLFIPGGWRDSPYPPAPSHVSSWVCQPPVLAPLEWSSASPFSFRPKRVNQDFEERRQGAGFKSSSTLSHCVIPGQAHLHSSQASVPSSVKWNSAAYQGCCENQGATAMRLTFSTDQTALGFD